MSRIEDEVCKKIAQRAEVGKSKYGVTMETSPISRLEWLIHAQEEAMDLAVYLQKLIEMETLNEEELHHANLATNHRYKKTMKVLLQTWSLKYI